MIIFVSVSCKKDHVKDNPVESAKAWYLKEQLNSSSYLTNKFGGSLEVIKELDWENQAVVSLDDGTEVTSVPVKMKLKNMELTNRVVQYCL